MYDHRSPGVPGALGDPGEEQARKEHQQPVRRGDRGEVNQGEERSAADVGRTEGYTEHPPLWRPSSAQAQQHPATEQCLLGQGDDQQLVKQVPEHPQQAAWPAEAPARWADRRLARGRSDTNETGVERCSAEFAQLERVGRGMRQQALAARLQDGRLTAWAGASRHDGDRAIEAIAQLQRASALADADQAWRRRGAAVQARIAGHQRGQRQAALAPKVAGDEIVAGSEERQQQGHHDKADGHRPERRSRAEAVDIARQATAGVEQRPAEERQRDQGAREVGDGRQRRPDRGEQRDPGAKGQRGDDGVARRVAVEGALARVVGWCWWGLACVGVVQGCASACASWSNRA